MSIDVSMVIRLQASTADSSIWHKSALFSIDKYYCIWGAARDAESASEAFAPIINQLLILHLSSLEMTSIDTNAAVVT